jgi:hypothetical protein
MTTRLRALAAAVEAYENETAGGYEVYVFDRGRNYESAHRYEAGLERNLGKVMGYRTSVVTASSWAALVERLHRRPADKRYSEARNWTGAAFDALAIGTDPATVAAACLQLNRWIEEG